MRWMNVEAMIAGPPPFSLLPTRYSTFSFCFFFVQTTHQIRYHVFGEQYQRMHIFEHVQCDQWIRSRRNESRKQSVCERGSEERTSATSSKSEKYKMCQYLFRFQFGKENTKGGKENEILKTLWQMTKFSVRWLSLLLLFFRFLIHIYCRDCAHGQIKYFTVVHSVSIVLPVRCVSATSSVYIRLINKYWSKLRSDIMLCVRALWVIFLFFF